MKRPQTKTKSKKKKSNKSKDEWAFDGGVVVENNNRKHDEGNDKSKRRKTQEFDEKMRRGRRKMFQNDITQKFNQKMSKKISFTDVFDKDDTFVKKSKTTDNSASNKQADSITKKSASTFAEDNEDENRDPKSVLNLLSKLIKKDLREKKSKSFIASAIESIIKNDSINYQDNFDKIDKSKQLHGNLDRERSPTEHSNTEMMNDSENAGNDGVDQEVVESEDIDTETLNEDIDVEGDEEDDDDEHMSGGKQTCFTWFFNSQEESQPQQSLTSSNNNSTTTSMTTPQSSSFNQLKKINFEDILVTTTTKDTQQQIDLVDSYELFGHVSKPEFINKIKTLGDLPNLPKMFKTRKHESINNDMTKVLLPYLSSYMDVFVERQEVQDDENIMNAMLIHSVNHIIKARMRVLRNNYKLKKRKENLLLLQASNESENNSKGQKNKSKSKTQKKNNKTNTGDESDSATQQQQQQEEHLLQDQGYVRPRVLILCPFRSSARKIVESIRDILGPNTTVSNSIKFEQEYGNNYEDEDEENEDYNNENNDDDDDTSTSLNGNSNKKQKRPKFRPRPKPKDYCDIFHDNIDDDFKMGLQINPGQGKGAGSEKGAYLRLFSDFFVSDIILASPIGLKLMVENNLNHALNYDFLSSLEIVMLNQADIMYMQNWEHVEFIMRQTNQLPTSDHNTDFSRVKAYFLEKNASLSHRQLLVSTYFTEPVIHSLFRQHGHSQAGCIKLKKMWNSHDGYISNVNMNIKQIFQKVVTTSLQTQDDDRFQYFCTNILSQLIRYDQSRTLIITPSYFHYVRVRNELIRREVDAAYICEYSRESEISRGRSRFFSGQKKILLYSGRAHFFRRFNLRGAMHVIFYSLPEHPHFYPELVNSLKEAESGGLGSETDTVTLFTGYEKMALERIVGSERCNHMMSSNKTTFVFK